MKQLGWLVLWIFASSAAVAQQTQISQQDFAYSVPIELPHEAALYRFTLPLVVYQNIVTQDYRDLRIFNADAEIVPHSLRSTQVPNNPQSPRISVPFYPYKTHKPGVAAATSLQVIINDLGAIVQSNRDADRVDQDRISAYLLDLAALQQPLTKLAFEWESVREDIVAKIKVEGSNDLTSWHTLVAQASLVSLQFAGRILKQQEVAVSGAGYKYLQVSWPVELAGVRLAQVYAHLAAPQQAIEPSWILLSGTADPQQGKVFYYKNDARVPVTQLEVELAQNNSLVDVKVASRDHEDKAWRARTQGIFYRLQVEDTKLNSTPVQISVLNDRFWRLTATSELAGLGPHVPVLKVGYIPHELVFLARGRPPFTLAFGSHAPLGQQSEVQVLLKHLNEGSKTAMLGVAQLGELQTLQGESALQAPPMPFPWQQAILWGVLLFGVLLLGALAWHLAQQMR